jgi:carboxymethylenebutenolidase
MRRAKFLRQHARVITSFRCGSAHFFRVSMRLAAGLAASVPLAVFGAQPPETVNFPSQDGKTRLIGYLWKPQGSKPFPAVVMLHGRAGSYSTAAKGVYSANTLTQRHKAWGEFWAERGYLALHVDSFGPRGYAQGFAIHSYKNRPAAVNEQTVRPLDAYGALAYLRGRGDVIADRVGVQGWSNGGMTVLAALADDAPGIAQPTPHTGFRAALAFYPGCREQEKRNYRSYAPLLMLLAAEDEDVSPVVCQRMAEQAIARGADLAFAVYPGAQHAFDDPGSRKQAHDANRAATLDARIRAEQFFARHLQK